jgi:hypothetical protein
MTELDLAVDEELSSSFEPCLEKNKHVLTKIRHFYNPNNVFIAYKVLIILAILVVYNPQYDIASIFYYSFHLSTLLFVVED